MADRPIIYPRIWGRTGNYEEKLAGIVGYPDNHGSVPWNVGGCIVALDGATGLLNPVVTDGVLAAGYVYEASAASANPNPPTTRKNPHYHLPWNLRGLLLLLNITDATGNVGEANGAPTLSEVIIGQRYAMKRNTSGAYDKYQFLDVDDTTNDFFEVIDKPALVDGIANVAATYNGLVVVKIVESCITL